jgi:hypothetical protein
MSCKEGNFTKIYLLDSPAEIEFVDKLASTGWILVNIIKHHTEENKWIYWFQSKQKVYRKTQLSQVINHHKGGKH